MFGQLQERKLAEAALQDRETLNSTQLGVKAAFALTWEELDPLAQQLGKLLSLFSPQSILWELVVWVATRGKNIEQTQAATQAQPADIISVELPTIKAPHPLIPSPYQGEGRQSAALAGWSSDELNEAKKQLYQRNLLQQVDERCYKIHALVRWFLQGQLAESGEMQLVLETTFATAMIAIAKSLPESPTSKDIEAINDVIPHIEDLGNRLIAEVNKAKEGQAISPASVPNDEVIWVFVGVGRFYEGQGLYKLAEPWREDCVNVCQALFVGDHPNVAASLNGLAELYKSLGRYSEAEPLLIEALAMRKRLFVGDHPNVASSLNNLAGLYDSLGRYSEAELLYIEALAMTKRMFVGDHPHVAQSLNNLALLYNNQGRYSDAEPKYIEALAMTKRLFVGDHPNLAVSLNNLALLYKSLGRYSDAELLYIEALAIDISKIETLCGKRV
jgi:tetratricopeptide (TPR) repeat protein